VTATPVPAPAPDTALDELLLRPETLFCALARDGFRMPMPASLDLAEERMVPVPSDRATMVDLVVPSDRMSVITTWERARTTGLAVCTVHTLAAPERLVSLTILDARPSHGIYLGALTEPDTDESAPVIDPMAGAMLIPLRPRTATIRKNMFAVMTAIDERTTRMLGWTAEETVGLRSIDFIHPDDHERALANWMGMLSSEAAQRVRVRHLCRDGSWLWVEVENVYEGADDPDEVVVTAHISDISDEMAAHEAMHRREQLFRRLAESLPTGVLQIEPDRSIAYANAQIATTLGVHGAQNLDEHLVHLVASDRAALDVAIHAALHHAIDDELEVSARQPGADELRRCTVTVRALTDKEGMPGALVCVSDITDSARMREELSIRATFDALTGCYNRASVIAALDHALDAGESRITAAIFIDLDNFKPVNDELGHAVGDELLVHVADSIKGELRADDIVGRLGGDEFLLVCQRLDEPSQALVIAERVADMLHREFSLSTSTVCARASIGVAFSYDSATSESLVARADHAMYESKQRGQGRPVAYEDLELTPTARVSSSRSD